MLDSHLRLAKFEAHFIITSLFKILDAKRALFKAYLLIIFICYRISYPVKWEIFLVPVRVTFFCFEKIENRT